MEVKIEPEVVVLNEEGRFCAHHYLYMSGSQFEDNIYCWHSVAGCSFYSSCASGTIVVSGYYKVN